MIRTVAETGSTNADLLALARAGAAEGYWLRAERQHAGRGRQGRPWLSPPGNFCASTLVRLRPTDPPAATLALLAAVAVEEAIGVFLAHHPDLADRPTTSLSGYGVTVAPAMLAEVLADGMARWLARWRGEGLAPVRVRWLARAHPVGTALTARLPDGGAIEGLFDGLDADGALVLRLASGDRRVIHAADVFLL